jgi:hypothetical protein
VIVWHINLQLPVRITTKVVILNPVDDDVYSVQHYVTDNQYRQTCIKRSLSGQRKGGFLRQVTS